MLKYETRNIRHERRTVRISTVLGHKFENKTQQNETQRNKTKDEQHCKMGNTVIFDKKNMNISRNDSTNKMSSIKSILRSAMPSGPSLDKKRKHVSFNKRVKVNPVANYKKELSTRRRSLIWYSDAEMKKIQSDFRHEVFYHTYNPPPPERHLHRERHHRHHRQSRTRQPFGQKPLEKW